MISMYPLRESTSFYMSISFEEKTKTEKNRFLFVFRHFFLISDVKSLKKVGNEQKRLKTAEKSSSTTFWVHAAPKSWSKYTTYGDN